MGTTKLTFTNCKGKLASPLIIQNVIFIYQLRLLLIIIPFQPLFLISHFLIKKKTHTKLYIVIFLLNNKSLWNSIAASRAYTAVPGKHLECTVVLKIPDVRTLYKMGLILIKISTGYTTLYVTSVVCFYFIIELRSQQLIKCVLYFYQSLTKRRVFMNDFVIHSRCFSELCQKGLKAVIN